ncbi:hypothetical protein BRD07_02330 [Halobacteriales archaeon QS_9_68_42]|nr:MAG: hypothetical protein BRD07_02330 [Halobacteriales archaeon QS_9_68_42]
MAGTRTFERPGAERAVCDTPSQPTRSIPPRRSVTTSTPIGRDNTVVVIIVSESGGADALNVASAVLAAGDEGVNELVVVPHAGDPEAGPTLGTTAKRLIKGADLPVVVVPLSP